MKTKIFIDFDGTLFDTDQLKVALFDILKKAGLKENDITKTYKASCLNYCYTPIDHIKRLGELKKFDQEKVLNGLKKVYKSLSKMVFKDTESFLNNIDRDKYEVNLLTLGDENFQRTKVKNSGLMKYFDNLYFTPEQKWNYLEKLVEKNEKFIIVDDRGDAMEKIGKKFRSSFPVEINRSSESMDIMEQPSSFAGVQIKDFKQLLKYL